MIRALKKLLKTLLPWGIRRRGVRLLDWVVTEFNFRFRRASVLQELQMARHLPMNLHIEGTNICNARCTFCAYPQMERAKEIMTPELFAKTIREYVALGGRYVSLTPIVGDPFADRFLFERLKLLQETPEIEAFDFYTNGILMKPPVIQKLQEFAPKLHVRISLGGFDRETYRATMGVDQFQAVRDNIEHYLAEKRGGSRCPPLTLALRCSPESCHGEFWNRCKQAESEGLLNVQLAGTFDSWAGKIQESELNKVGLRATPVPHKRGACELLFMKPVILANGKVNACACRDVEAELIIGDLGQSSLAEIWNGEGITDLIERHERGDFPDVCRRCTWYVSIYNSRKRSLRINPAALARNRPDQAVG